MSFDLLEKMATHWEIPMGIVFFVFIVSISFLTHRYSILKKNILVFKLEASGPEQNDNIVLKFYKENCEKISTIRNRIIFKEDPVDFVSKKIQSHFKHSRSFKVGQYFTGISLIFTFLLMGQAVYKIGKKLPEITKKSDSNTEINTSDLPKKDVKNVKLSSPRGEVESKNPIEDLGKSISDLRSKFWVSVLGIILSIIYQFYSLHLAKNLYMFTTGKLSFLREKGDLHSFADLDCQFQQFEELKQINLHFKNHIANSKDDLGEIKTSLANLQEIDVKVGDLAENVTKQLENVIDRSVGQRLTELLAAQKETTEKMATELGKALADSVGKELEASFSKLAEALPKIVMGGAVGTSERVAETFEKISATLPSLIDKMNLVVMQLQASQDQHIEGGRKVNQDLLKALNLASENHNVMNQASTEAQAKLISSLQSTIEQLNESSKRGVNDTQKALEKGATDFGKGIATAGESLGHTLNSFKDTIKDIEGLASTLRKSNVDVLSSVNTSLTELKTTIDFVRSQNQTMGVSLGHLSNISTKLAEAPENTKKMIIDTLASNAKFEESAISVRDSFVSGVEKLSSLFVAKIKLIEDETKNIEKAYSGASSGLAEALTPIEDLSDNIEQLNKSLKESSLIRG